MSNFMRNSPFNFQLFLLLAALNTPLLTQALTSQQQVYMNSQMGQDNPLTQSSNSQATSNPNTPQFQCTAIGSAGVPVTITGSISGKASRLALSQCQANPANNNSCVVRCPSANSNITGYQAPAYQNPSYQNQTYQAQTYQAPNYQSSQTYNPNNSNSPNSFNNSNNFNNSANQNSKQNKPAPTPIYYTAPAPAIQAIQAIQAAQPAQTPAPSDNSNNSNNSNNPYTQQMGN